jgi:hypothetical protein
MLDNDTLSSSEWAVFKEGIMKTKVRECRIRPANAALTEWLRAADRYVGKSDVTGREAAQETIDHEDRGYYVFSQGKRSFVPWHSGTRVRHLNWRSTA